MDRENQHIIAIQTKEGKQLSKLQKQFNNYSQKVDKLKQALTNTQTVLEKAQQKVNDFLVPLEKQKIELKIQSLWTLDKVHDSGVLKKRDNETLAEFIVTQVYPLIADLGYEDLKPLFEKYEGQSFDEYNQQANEETGGMMKEMFANMGIDMDEDADFSDVNTFKEAYERKIEQEAATEEERKANKKKTAKQIAKEEKIRQEAQNITKTVRSVYMQLVKEFHPDREPDALEKERKTLIMQRITQAYENDDLFELLRLQLEYKQKDHGDFELLPDEQLKYYNKLLKEQIDELEAELYSLQMGDNPFVPSLYSQLCMPPERLDANVKREVNVLKKYIKQLKEEVQILRDPVYVRELLKAFKQEQKRMARNPFSF
ncbi:hypothetical protein [Xanthocytophaga agilis]|uniref:Molecular chaperone DnaJ n=1 Tax=Xanthocytophaga agilis TaxID=3048010 RepID=A0AAE3UC59_9BACT|nr:hypothetical protein [Xanthocytophaga agilis]MDJ1499755.1 hypothetical protein [Xanthocytophaga agilis]